MHCLYCGINLTHYVILNDKCPGCHSNISNNQIYAGKESETLKELLSTVMDTQQIDTIFEDPLKTAAATVAIDMFSDAMKNADKLTTKHTIKCYHCEHELNSYSTLNDGGTIICPECHKYFHPEQNGIPAHPHINSGPLSCDICNPQ